MILNYKTYSDTLELILNLKEQIWFKKIKIYVVENGSKNGSREELKKAQDKYDFELIISDENLGFANGNNLGIEKARKDGCEFIVCSNNGINITKQDKTKKKLITFLSIKALLMLLKFGVSNGGSYKRRVFYCFSQ